MFNQYRFAVATVLAVGCSASPDPLTSPGTGGAGGTTSTGGSSPNTGGNASSTGGTNATPTGGVTQTSTGGSTASTGGSTASTGGSTASTGGSTASTGGSTASTGGSTANTGGSTANTGGSTANTGGSTTNTGGSAGTTSTGGAKATGGASGSTASGGATQTGGSAGTTSTGTGGGAGNTRPATPSAGCGKGARPSGGVVTVAGDHIYTFPTNYDGSTAMPLVIGFHAAGNPIDQIKNIVKGTDLEKNYVMAFPKSAGSGWVTSTDNAKITSMYADLLANYCIDTSRVFATGHSSGAQLIVQMMCAGDKRFRAIAPVASSAYCAKWTAIPSFVVHGSNDQERASTSQDADGKKDLAPYLASNTCTMTTLPYAMASCKSSYNQATVEPGCVEYQGCSQPTIWCHHNDGNYSGTNHGWPCFAANAMAAFFAKQ